MSKKKSKAIPTHFKIATFDSIGSASAEADTDFLADCFVDHGYLERIRDCRNPARIVVGNTGAGKSALMSRLGQTCERVIDVAPETLAINHISNSDILQFLAGLGVRMDTFYKLLWRHVLLIEVIQRRFDITPGSPKPSVIERVKNLFRVHHRRLLNYFENHASDFFVEREVRVTTVTETLEKKIDAELKGTIPGSDVGGRLAAARSLSVEKQSELRERVQHVVNASQIKELGGLIVALDEALSDTQKPYYLTIDGLDEDWVDDAIRFRLIRALIETARDFRKVKNAKIVVAMRRDLLDRVLLETRDIGLQAEKIREMYLPLSWTRAQLVEVMDTRIAHLVKKRFAKSQTVYHSDLFPTAIDRVAFKDAVFKQLVHRPRDVLEFVNICLRRSDGKKGITSKVVKESLGDYSRYRLGATLDEWRGIYPNLEHYVQLLKKRPHSYKLHEITDEQLNELPIMEPLANLDAVAAAYLNSDARNLRIQLAVAYYRSGIAGLKIDSQNSAEFSEAGRTISTAEITDEASIVIHGAYWRVLGTQVRSSIA